LNRLEEAKAVAEQASSQGADSASTHSMLFEIAFIHGDQAAMQREASWGAGTPEEVFVLVTAANALDSIGKIKGGREARQRAMSGATRYGMNEFASILQAVQAGRDASHGYTTLAQAEAAEALRQYPKGNMRMVAAVALAQTGDTARSRKLIDAISQDFPDDTLLHAVTLPGVGFYFTFVGWGSCA
jgi:hypothetical protein